MAQAARRRRSRRSRRDRSGFQQITVTVGRPLTIELASGARIEVPPENLEAVRTVVREVVRAERPVEEGTVRC